MMESMKASLSKYIVKRRLEGGEFLYVYRPRGQSVAGKKAVWSILKSDDKTLNKLREATGLSDEEEFENIALKTLPLLPYEDAVNRTETKTTDMETNEETKVKEEVEDEEEFEMMSIPREDLSRSVIVKNFPRKATAQDCEIFLRMFDPTVIMRREMGKNKTGVQVFKGIYCLSFSDTTKAKQFLDKKEALVFNGKVLNVGSCVHLAQRNTVFKGTVKLFSLPLAWAARLVGETESRECCVFGVGIGKLSDQRLSQVFCGMEAEFDNISSVKNVYIKAGQTLKYQFIQFEFTDQKSAEEFSNKQNKTVDGKLLNTITYNDYQKQVAGFGSLSHIDISGQTENNIVLICNKPCLEAEKMFPSKKSVRMINLGFSKAFIVEFNNEMEAMEAASQYLPDVPVGSIIPLADYLKLYEEMKGLPNIARRIKKIERDVQNVVSEVSPTNIVLKDKNQVDEVKTAKTGSTKSSGTHRGTQTSERNNIINRRRNRGESVWDLFVVVGELRPSNRSLGTPTDQDICNYFLQNHRDVADVKFLSWTTVPTVVVVKFISVPAAECFLSLEYVLFYGNEVTRNDVETFLKKKSDAQKDEVARLCLGKPYISLLQAGTAGGSDCHVGLSGLTSKDPELRNLFISQLHLAEKDVGKPQWEKAANEKLIAKFALKLEDNAVDFLVRKWNELEIDVGGEKVLAEVINSKRGVKRTEGHSNSKGFGKKKKKKKVA